MADRFPLIVNSVSKKIEELVSGDNLDLTGNGIIVSGDTGASKYLTSDGTTVFWDSPGDVYLSQTQTVSNKTFETCVISGSVNTFSNIPNIALVNSSISINGSNISLGGTVVTPDNNTTYTISAQDGLSNSQKVLRLTSGGNFGSGVDDDIVLSVGSPASVPAGSQGLSLFLDRSGEEITISGHVVDTNTITTITAPGGSPTSGAISFAATNAASVSMSGSVVTVDAIDTDTKTKIRATAGGTFGPSDNTTGNFTFLDGTGTTVSQGVDGNGDGTITYTSTDTVTQIRGGSTGTYTPSTTGTATTQISIEGGSGGNVTVSQSGNTVLIDSTDTNTITKVGSDNNGSPVAPVAGDFILKQAGATTITQSTNNSGQVELTISSINSDTGATLTASGGILLSTSDFQLKNYANFSGNTLLKWDSGNEQLADSIITDDGTTVTIGGDLVVSGTQTIFNTSVLQVEDNIIELRKGNNLTGFEAGIQVNRITDASGVVTSYQQLQWNESGGYWRSWDGSVENRFVTENETQVLTNKTLTNPTFTTPTLGAAEATSINGLEIASTASASLDIQSGKAVDINNDLTFTSDNATSNVNVNFRTGGDVAYKSDTLASFSSTTSTQLRTLISGTTGTDDLVFQTSPVILTSLVTTSTGFALLNSGAQSIQFGGAATAIDVGAQSGTVTFNGDVIVAKDLTVGAADTDLFTCNARIDVANSDILIRGGSSDPMTVGRGTSSVSTNTAVGKQALFSVSSGSQSTATGYEALLTANTGAGNSSYGYQALRNTGVGDNNTAVGRSSMLSNLSGDSNTALGSNSLESNTVGNANVAIGFYAGFNATGSGNVLIGPADSTNPVNDATYSPLNAAGDRQLVIGSGTEFWIRGDQNFDVTLNNDVTVNNSLTVKGDFVVNGVTTTVQSNTLEIADKNIELAKVSSTQFTCTTTDGSAAISSISPTLGLIPGMVVTSNTAGVSVPGGTTIASITGNNATLSNNVTGSGTPTFSAIGPSDTAANGGGIILKGTTDHTFTWSDANDAWQSSEDMELVNGKTYNIIDGSGNPQQMISLTQIGPSSGAVTLGSGVTGSALTSVGTLTSLSCSGDINLVDNGTLFGNSGATGILTLRSASGNANHSKIEVGVTQSSDNGGIHFYTAGSSTPQRALTIKGTSQHIGIGVDDPNAKLHIGSGSSSAAGDATNPALQIGDATNYRFGAYTTNEGAIIANKNGDDGIVFHTKTGALDGTFGEAVRIDANGNVGVGSDNPTQPMTLKRSSSGQGEFGYRLEFEDTDGPTQTSSALLVGSYGLKLKNYNSGRNFIFETGNALFGGLTAQDTSTDSSKLAVQGGDSNIGAIQIHSGGGENAGDLSGIAFSHGADNITARPKCAIASRAIGAYGKAHLCFYVDGENDNGAVSDADEKMRISTDGSVTKPSNALLKTNSSSNYGTAGSLTTNTANTGISQGAAAINKGNTGWTTTGTNAYTFVCPVDGVYVVHANVSYGNGISGRQIWVMSYTLGGGNLPLDAYVEIIDHTAVSYGNYSYYDTYEFTAGTRVGMGKNGGSGTMTGQSLKWGIHLLQ